MNFYFKYLSLVALLAIVGCEKKELISAYDVLQVNEIVPLLVRLPGDLSEDEELAIELFSEKGVEASRSVGTGFKGREIVKLFIHGNDGYRISVVTDRMSTSKSPFDYGEARLRIWVGNPDQTISRVGESLAAFSVDGSASMNPRGDDLAIRLVVSGRTSQDR